MKLSAIQMDVTPGPTSDRLARAQQLIEQATQDGAQLIVLPEVFNTGYRYVAKIISAPKPPTERLSPG